MSADFRISLALAASVIVLPASAWGEPVPPSAQEAVYLEDGLVRLTIDRAELLALERPAGTVILGSTAIATATLSDDRTLILTGQTTGSTNLIVLDADGAEIIDTVLWVVERPELVTVHQGEQRQTYTCVRRCDPVLSVGDDAEFFSTTASQMGVRQGLTGDGAAGQ